MHCCDVQLLFPQSESRNCFASSETNRVDDDTFWTWIVWTEQAESSLSVHQLTPPPSPGLFPWQRCDPKCLMAIPVLPACLLLLRCLLMKAGLAWLRPSAVCCTTIIATIIVQQGMLAAQKPPLLALRVTSRHMRHGHIIHRICLTCASACF